MKTRILSLVLALVMVVSMAAVFSFTSSAETTGLTVTVGSTYAVAGETALIQIYVSADALADGIDHIRNWQFQFEAEGGIVLGANGEHVLYVSEGSAYAFTNDGLQQVGNTSDTGYNCGTAEQVLAKGGWCIGKIAVAIPAGLAAGEYAFSITTIDALGFENADGSVKYAVTTTTKPGDYEATAVAGKVIVVPSVEGGCDVYEGAGEDYAIPSVNAAGARVNTGLIDETFDDLAVVGEFDTIVIPASIVNDIGDLLDGFSFNKLVLKGTDLGAVAATIAGKGSSSNPVQVYIHKRANGAGTTADGFDKLSNLNKKKVNVHNILASYENVVVNGNVATFLCGITVNDTDYSKLAISLNFDGSRVKEKEIHKIYTTVTGVATVDEDTANASGLTLVEGKYLTALSVKGVPAGEHTVTVTLFGWTPDADGCPIVVASDPVEVTVNV